jgi:HEAT repeat protein
MKFTKAVFVGVLIIGLVTFSDAALAKRRSRSRKYYPPLTHPVVLWARTLTDSQDVEQRKIAAFKLSQYSQSIYQEEVINTLLKCIKDPDEHIKVFCAKAMGRASSKSKTDSIRKVLIEQYKQDAQIRGTLVRTFIQRKDSNPIIQETLLETVKQSNDPEDLLPILDYIEQYGTTQAIDPLIALYQKTDNIKIKRGVVKVLTEKGQGQDTIVNLLTQCLESGDTTLTLTCLSALQVQSKKDAKTLSAVEKTIESSDPDVILASLEVIQSLPESPNPKISERLIELVDTSSDSEVLEKSILALGVCGDFSETTVKALQKSLNKKDLDEGVRISAALSLGKQAEKFPESPRADLNECKSTANSESLKTACQLAIQELQVRTKKLQTPSTDVKTSPTNNPQKES